MATDCGDETSQNRNNQLSSGITIHVINTALASSSPLMLIDATIAALRLEGIFTTKSSGENLQYGKPHPEVYLNACDALSVEPQNCVVIEDSFVGRLAAKAAQMKTIVIPEPSVVDQNHFVIADKKLRSLEELTLEMIQSL